MTSAAIKSFGRNCCLLFVFLTSIELSAGDQSTEDEVDVLLKNQSVIEHSSDTRPLKVTSIEDAHSEMRMTLAQLNRQIQTMADKQAEDQFGTLKISLISGIVVGVFSIVGQILIINIRNKNDINKYIMNWRVQQLSELYGPLYALLNQSTVLYRHMNQVLVNSDSERFRLGYDDEKCDVDNKKFQIYEGTKWEDFRTVNHLISVYGENYQIEGYFDEIIKVGERIVKIIEEKAGYVRENDAELAQIFGKYLAHYAVLREVYNTVKTNLHSQSNDMTTPVLDSLVDQSVPFPRDIQKLVSDGHRSLSNQLKNWGETSNQ